MALESPYLFTEDLARLVLEISQSEPLNDYFNVSNNENLEIKELAEFIAKTFNYTGNVVFDNNIKYDGQFRKDVTSKKLLNTLKTKFTNFENGIYLTKKWLENNNELSLTNTITKTNTVNKQVEKDSRKTNLW